jgi:hypothetical protein
MAHLMALRLEGEAEEGEKRPDDEAGPYRALSCSLLKRK